MNDVQQLLPILLAVFIGVAVLGVLAFKLLAPTYRKGPIAPPADRAPLDSAASGSTAAGTDVLDRDGSGVLDRDGSDVLTPTAPDTLEGIEDLAPAPVEAPARTLDVPESPATRLARLRERLAKSNSLLGKGLLALLSSDDIDDFVWDEIEENLLLADIGAEASEDLVESLKRRVKAEGTKDPAAVKKMLKEELVRVIDPTLDRSLAVDRQGDQPAVLIVVGVNGVGKTTTVGKLARVLVAQDKDVVLGAADTFRAAASQQLTTWGERVGVPTVKSDKEGADPSSVAFEAVKAGIDGEADVVIIDTAGRLQNKANLMDELGKLKRVTEKQAEISEVLLVLDATTGQNGLSQAKVFSEAVSITGIVLTKLDGSAKGGIVVPIQRTLGVPVKLIGLGEGPDDLAPFDVEGFVDALLE